MLIEPEHENLRVGSAQHVHVAKPVIQTIMCIMGILSALAIIGGTAAIIWNAFSPTQTNLFEASISTGYVGVAFAALGLICMVFVLRAVLTNIYRLAALPNE
jgi:hypothetical protein